MRNNKLFSDMSMTRSTMVNNYNDMKREMRRDKQKPCKKLMIALEFVF